MIVIPSLPSSRALLCVGLFAVALMLGCGGSGGSSGGGGGQVPTPPTGLTATPGNTQVSLSWTGSAGATGYHVKRGSTSGGPYTQIAAPTTASYTDTSLTNGTTYYYVVSASNASGESGNSSEVSATPAAPSNAINVTIDVLANRHPISPYVYGAAYPQSASTVTDLGISVVRWGGNATSTYNWKLGTYNADNDWYFEDFAISGFNDGSDPDSTQFIKDVKAAGGNPLMTMVMLPWVAQGAENAGNGHWSFPASVWPSQCKFDPYNNQAGDGLQSDCQTPVTTSPVTSAYYPLVDQSTQCPSGTSESAGNCLVRSTWAAALASAFGSAPHFYDMDNEIDIWGGTHFDIHPTPSSYNELRDVFLQNARNLKTWDPAAIRLGPVSCCWWFYWNGANSSDRAAHAGLDFLPWWLNAINWQDQIDGTRSLDAFDIHAYPEGPDLSHATLAQKQAAAVSIYRDYWDPTFQSPACTSEYQWATTIQPMHCIPFRIPRMRAIANMIYPGTPLAITEWSAEFAGASDFSNALGDADALGILGRERVYLASRWTAPSSSNPNYLAFKLYTNYDGNYHGFAPISISDTNDGDPNLFSSYAAISADAKTMTIMVINKDPANAAKLQFSFANSSFSPTSFVSYKLTSTTPTSIAASQPQSWKSNMSFDPYSVTLLVVSGTGTIPATEWDLNPDTIMLPAGGTTTLHPTITSGSGTVALNSPQFDTGITVNVTQTPITSSQTGKITVTAAGNTTPGFYHYTVDGTDSNSVVQKQGGWIVVGNPAATLAKSSGDSQSGAAGSTLQPLQVTLTAGQSGGSTSGACILFTTTAGSLATAADPNSICTNGVNKNSGSKVIAVTDSNGVATVTLTLPGASGTVSVKAEGPYGLGHPVLSQPFTETSN